MSAQHVPGPWEFRLEAVRTVIFHKGEIGERAIAVGAGFYPDHIPNARLIAAAPELLEALEVIAGGDVDVSNTAIIVGNGASTVMDQVRAAIAKATGAA